MLLFASIKENFEEEYRKLHYDKQLEDIEELIFYEYDKQLEK
jgi:hypothetical protein